MHSDSFTELDTRETGQRLDEFTKGVWQQEAEDVLH